MELTINNHSNPGPIIDDEILSRAWEINEQTDQSIITTTCFQQDMFLFMPSPVDIKTDPVIYNTCCGLAPYLVLALLPSNPKTIKLLSFIKYGFCQIDMIADPKFSLYHENGFGLDAKVLQPTKIDIPLTGKHAFVIALAAKIKFKEINFEVNESPDWDVYSSTTIVPDHSFVVFQEDDKFRLVQGFLGHYTYQQFAANTVELESFIPACPKPTLKNWHGEVCPKPKYRGTFDRTKMLKLLQDLERLNGRLKKTLTQYIYAGITGVMFRKEILPEQFLIKVLHVTLP